jgi:hypothetical protein
MKGRDSEGRFRNHNTPTGLSANTIRARWVEAEVLRMKRLGFTFETIAEQITEVGRGRKNPLTPLPDGITFSSDFSITPMGCHKALNRALMRSPALEVGQMRRVDTDRLEDMLVSLWPAIRQGDPQAVRAGVQALALKAAINGYKGADTQVNISRERSWEAVMTKDQTVGLIRDAMMVLIERGVSITEMAQVSGVDVPAIEASATKIEDNDS